MPRSSPLPAPSAPSLLWLDGGLCLSGRLFPGECDFWERGGHWAVSAWHLFLQGDDSLSAITLDSDVETVSVVGRPPRVPGLVVP